MRIDRFDSIAATAHQHVILQPNKLQLLIYGTVCLRDACSVANPLAYVISLSLTRRLSQALCGCGRFVGALLWDGGHG